MAEANRKTSYDSPVNREDLVDIVYNVDPWECPFITRIPSTSATNRTHDWPIDVLRAPNASNAALEGDETTINASTNPTRATNECQILKESTMVSGTQEYIIQAGVDDEVDYQLVKKTKELRTDLETITLGNQARDAGNKATTARNLASVQSWIATNYTQATGVTGGSAPTGDGSDTRTAATSNGTIVEGDFKTCAQNTWNEGGNPDMALLGPALKTKFSTFTGNATRFKGAEDRQLVAAIDIYDGDFGEYEIVADRFAAADYVFLCETEMWALAELRPLYSEPLGKTGDAEKWQLIWECTLEARNEKSSGCVADADP